MDATDARILRQAERTAALARRIAELKRQEGAAKFYGEQHVRDWEAGADRAQAFADTLREIVKEDE